MPLYDPYGRALLETPAPAQPVQLRAAAGSLFDAEDAGWTRLTGNPKRDLSPMRQDRQIEIATYLYRENPMAKWLLEITRDFIMAEGVSVQCEDEDAQAVLTAFWDDPINFLDLKLEQKVLELSLYGEQLWPVFVNESTGLVRLANVDPSRIKAVEHDPDNAEVPIGITLKGRAGHNGKRLRVLYPAPDEELFAAQALRQRAETYIDGDCFWFSINSVSTATRGVSDLFALGDWLDGYEQFLFNTLDRTGFLNAFCWDITLTGMSQEAVNAWAGTFAAPKPGSFFAHNEQVTMQAVSPDLKGADTSEHARLFRNQILGGMGVPSIWFGGGEDANLASATVMGVPTFKRLQRRQRLVRYIVQYLCRYQLQQAQRVGALGRGDLPEAKIVLPQLQAEDLSRIGPALQQLTAACLQAEERGWIQPETSQQIFAAVAGRLGVEVPLSAPGELEAERPVTQDYRRNGTPVPAGNNGRNQ
jgi:hypothetical protein